MVQGLGWRVEEVPGHRASQAGMEVSNYTPLAAASRTECVRCEWLCCQYGKLAF